MTRRRVVAALAAVGMVAGGVAGGVALAADDDPTAACTSAPKVVDDGADQKITVVCQVPKPAPVTTTVEVPGPTVTVTATPTQEPTPTPTSTPSSTPTATPSPTIPPPTSGFPTEANTGLPAGWTPTRTINGDYTVTTAGAVVQDIRVKGTLFVAAPNVTLRRVDVVGGSIDNSGNTCRNGLTIADSHVATGTDGATGGGYPAILTGGYTADNVLITDSSEGFRDGGFEDIGCGPVVIRNSYAHVVPPDDCGDWHGDTLQGYDPAALTVRNTVLMFDESATCGGTGAFTYATNPGAKVDIDGLIVKGGGYPIRLDGPGTVKNLHIVRDDWYGPTDVNCGRLSSWQAQIVTLDANGQPVPVRNQPCN